MKRVKIEKLGSGPMLPAEGIAWVPRDVAVSDDRGHVAGAFVRVSDGRSGTVIPEEEEGGGIDRWAERALWEPPAGVAPREWALMLDRAAREGAAGRAGKDSLH